MREENADVVVSEVQVMEQGEKKPKKVTKVSVKAKPKAKAPRAKRLKGPLPRAKKGPASKVVKVKTNREPGVCTKLRCGSKTASPRSKWCKAHKKEVRALQLKLNNVVWRKRVEKGVAGHYESYRGRPTRAAAAL